MSILQELIDKIRAASQPGSDLAIIADCLEEKGEGMEPILMQIIVDHLVKPGFPQRWEMEKLHNEHDAWKWILENIQKYHLGLTLLGPPIVMRSS